MTRIIKYIYQREHRLEAAAEHFLFCHPYLGFLTLSIGMPLLIFAAVAVSTIVISFLLALLFGWL